MTIHLVNPSHVSVGIGEVARPKLDRKRLPKGSGWVCFAGADPAHPIGSCARTAKECADQYNLDRYVLGSSEGCKPQRSAYVRHTVEQIFLIALQAFRVFVDTIGVEQACIEHAHGQVEPILNGVEINLVAQDMAVNGLQEREA